MYLIKAFMESLHVAIDLYEDRFKKNKKDVPDHRIFDLIELRALLKDTDKTIKETYEGINALMGSMKTGIIIGEEVIMSTGNSRLKKHLHQVLDRPNYTLENLLKEQARASKIAMQHQEKNESKGEEFELLQQKILIQHDIIGQQAKQLELLQQENHSLHQEIGDLKKQLIQLQQTNQELMSKLSPDGISGNPLAPPPNNPFEKLSDIPPPQANKSASGFFSKSY